MATKFDQVVDLRLAADDDPSKTDEFKQAEAALSDEDRALYEVNYANRAARRDAERESAQAGNVASGPGLGAETPTAVV